jgi:hypothetical protein
MRIYVHRRILPEQKWTSYDSIPSSRQLALTPTSDAWNNERHIYLVVENVGNLCGMVHRKRRSCGLVTTIQLIIASGGTAPCTSCLSTRWRCKSHKLHLIDVQSYVLHYCAYSMVHQNVGNSLPIHTASKLLVQTTTCIFSIMKTWNFGDERYRKNWKKQVKRGYNQPSSKTVLP